MFIKYLNPNRYFIKLKMVAKKKPAKSAKKGEKKTKK
jgi:hypothetical protein